MASRADTEFSRIASVSSIGGLIAATLFAATVSDSQSPEPCLDDGQITRLICVSLKSLLCDSFGEVLASPVISPFFL